MNLHYITIPQGGGRNSLPREREDHVQGKARQTVGTAPAPSAG
jgi:hypothetical protein